MALRPCKECGKRVSDQAATCPHCGIGEPAAVPFEEPPKKKPRRLVLTGIGVALFLFAAHYFGSEPSPSSADTGQRSTGTIAIIGERGQLSQPTWGCPNLDDIKALDDQEAKAKQANDTVGEGQAGARALAAGCFLLMSGSKGLVIDSSGFIFGYTQIRLDVDSNAYWVPKELVALVEPSDQPPGQ